MQTMMAVTLGRYNRRLWTPDLEPLPSTLTPMGLCKGTYCSTPVLRQLRGLYKIPITSRKFEPAFDRFYSNTEYERITENLDNVELEEFIGFLDEVRCSLHHLDSDFNHQVRCYRLKT